MKGSIGLKIAVMNIAVITVVICIGIANYYSTEKMTTAANWRQHSYEVEFGLQSLLSVLIDAETGQRGYLVTKDDHFLEPYNYALTSIPERFAELKKLTIDSPTQQHTLEIMLPLINAKLQNIKDTMTIVNPAEQLKGMEEGKNIMLNIRDIIKQMSAEENRLLTERVQTATTSQNTTFDVIAYSTGLAVIVLILFGIYLARQLSIPLRHMTTVATKIAGGNLDVHFQPLTRSDEVGVLSQALAKMANNLTQYTRENHEVVDQLNLSVNKIATSIAQLVTAGNETAAAVSETTSTIEEIRQTSQISNTKAKSVSEEAQIAAEISQSGKAATLETNEGIKNIRDHMLAIAEMMAALSEQTHGITSIVETVDDLAQQSNLLSVNASIEAEKAGDNGRGFRVVAQEIRNLADQSKQATHRVREILTDISKATTSAVLATEQGNKIAEGGLMKSEKSGDTINKLTGSIMEAAQAAIQIATAHQQQLVGLEQATTAMENIKLASTQNVSSAKELELSAKSLKDIGSKLQKIVKKYRITHTQDKPEQRLS